MIWDYWKVLKYNPVQPPPSRKNLSKRARVSQGFGDFPQSTIFAEISCIDLKNFKGILFLTAEIGTSRALENSQDRFQKIKLLKIIFWSIKKYKYLFRFRFFGSFLSWFPSKQAHFRVMMRFCNIKAVLITQSVCWLPLGMDFLSKYRIFSSLPVGPALHRPSTFDGLGIDHSVLTNLQKRFSEGFLKDQRVEKDTWKYLLD